MGRFVTFSVVKRKNPIDKDAPAKFYAQAQSSGDVDVVEMSDRIERACTVNSADVLAVLKALEDEIIVGLQKGEIVRLGSIGTFQVGLRSGGADKEEDFKSVLIKKARVNFRSGKRLRDMLKILEYGKVSTRAAKAPAGEGGGDVEDPTA